MTAETFTAATMTPSRSPCPATGSCSRATRTDRPTLLGALLVALLAAVQVASAPAIQAAEPASPGQAGRYTMSPTDGGFVRLDTRTGAMALCRPSGDDWTCEDMRDATASLRAENDRLRAEIASLKAENRRLEETLLGPDKDAERQAGPDSARPGPGPGADPGPGFKLPSEQDVDRAFSYLQGMIKKFREKLDELEKSSPPADKQGTPL